MSWDEDEFLEEDFEEEEETSIEEKARERGRGEKQARQAKVLSDPEILATEILSSRKHLAVFLKLAGRPCTAKELVNSSIMVKVKRKAREHYEEVVKEEWRVKRLPKSTMYRILKRLKDLGLVEVYKGLDYRKRYYRLTDLGRKVLEKIVETIKETLRDDLKPSKELDLEEYKGYRGLSEEKFKELVYEKIRLPFRDVMKALNARRVKGSYYTYYLVDYTPKPEEKREEYTSSYW